MRLRVLALLFLLPLSALAAVPTSASAADPMTGAPAVGACYDLTLEQAYQEATGKRPVDCSAKHTIVVGAVGQVPDGVRWKDDRRLAAAADKICDPFWNRQTNRSHVVRYRSLLVRYWLMPTRAQREDGARWISCLVGMQVGDRLVALPQGELPRATKNPADSIARCTTRSGQFTPCSASHSWRVSHTFATKATGGAEARQQKLRTAVQRVCPGHVSTRRFLWSAKAKTSTSTTYAVACFRKTSR